MSLLVGPTPEKWELDLLIAGYKEEVKLSSLIAACGDRFGSLMLNGIDGRWKAREIYGGKNGNEYYDGKTPEEAVAKLWLKLNKK